MRKGGTYHYHPRNSGGHTHHYTLLIFPAIQKVVGSDCIYPPLDLSSGECKCRKCNCSPHLSGHLRVGWSVTLTITSSLLNPLFNLFTLFLWVSGHRRTRSGNDFYFTLLLSGNSSARRTPPSQLQLSERLGGVDDWSPSHCWVTKVTNSKSHTLAFKNRDRTHPNTHI